MGAGLCRLKSYILLAVLALPTELYSQQVIKLYGEQSAPFSKSNALKEYEADCWGATCVYDVVTPTLTLFETKNSDRVPAVIILAGGGYETQAIYHEGFDVAKKLAANGIFASVLKYRLPKLESATKPELVPITDVRAALTLLRQKHEELNIDPNRVGVMGFSAGGHLATVASVHGVKDETQNPDFSLLIYGVTRLTKENLRWLQDSLYHGPLSKEEVEYNTLLNHVSSDTPPAFLVHAIDDDICHYSESTLYAEALTKNKVGVETHLFPTGGHGFGLGHKEHGTDQWIDLAINWIKRL